MKSKLSEKHGLYVQMIWQTSCSFSVMFWVLIGSCNITCCFYRTPDFYLVTNLFLLFTAWDVRPLLGWVLNHLQASQARSPWYWSHTFFSFHPSEVECCILCTNKKNGWSTNCLLCFLQHVFKRKMLMSFIKAINIRLEPYGWIWNDWKNIANGFYARKVLVVISTGKSDYGGVLQMVASYYCDIS